MFSSKVIKTDEPDKNGVRNFYLQQFPEDDKDGQATESGATACRSTTTVDAARLSAERIRVEAQQEAGLTIQTAQQKSVLIEKEAFERGYADGVQTGMCKGEAEFQAQIQQLAGITAEFRKLQEAFYADHQDIIIELALGIARKVIHAEVSTNRELVISVLKAAVKLAVERERLKIRVHPEDIELCIQKRPGILKEIDGIQQIIFEADESVGRAGAVIEYAFGEIDARIEQQFDEIENTLHQSQLERNNASEHI
jgi:flagellar assembly protein FliH